jgi:hypothetical protein
MKCKIKIEYYDEELYDIWFNRQIAISTEGYDEYTFQFFNGDEKVEKTTSSPNYKHVRLLAKLKIESMKYKQIKESILEKMK